MQTFEAVCTANEQQPDGTIGLSSFSSEYLIASRSL
jgi:hypothetical protein